jgi:hypothetical protein
LPKKVTSFGWKIPEEKHGNKQQQKMIKQRKKRQSDR